MNTSSIFDFEHGKIFENIPFIILFGLMSVMFLPQIPASIKGVLMPVGMGAAIVSMFGMGWYARVAAAENMVLVAQLMPYGISKEFHCKVPVGQISSSYNPATQTYITPFDLARPTQVPDGSGGMMEADKIEIEHRLPWPRRCKPSTGWVHFNGLEVKSSNVILVQLFPQLRAPLISNTLEVVPRYTLASGNMDFYLLRGKERNDLELEEAII
jgi:hypothetical protein